MSNLAQSLRRQPSSDLGGFLDVFPSNVNRRSRDRENLGSELAFANSNSLVTQTGMSSVSARSSHYSLVCRQGRSETTKGSPTLPMAQCLTTPPLLYFSSVVNYTSSEISQEPHLLSLLGVVANSMRPHSPVFTEPEPESGRRREAPLISPSCMVGEGSQGAKI